NCQMCNITVTYRDGRIAQLENVYIRGSKIRFLILPDMLKNAPMFKKVAGKGPPAAAGGRGKSAILRAQGKKLMLSKEYVVAMLILTELFTVSWKLYDFFFIFSCAR